MLSIVTAMLKSPHPAFRSSLPLYYYYFLIQLKLTSVSSELIQWKGMTKEKLSMEALAFISVLSVSMELCSFPAAAGKGLIAGHETYAALPWITPPKLRLLFEGVMGL